MYGAYLPRFTDTLQMLQFNLDSSVGWGKVYGFAGVGQGAMTWNSHCISMKYSAAMCPQNRVICTEVGTIKKQ